MESKELDKLKEEAQHPHAVESGGPAVEQMHGRTREQLLEGKPDIVPFEDEEVIYNPDPMQKKPAPDLTATVSDALWVEALKKEISDNYNFVAGAIGELQRIARKCDDRINAILKEIALLDVRLADVERGANSGAPMNRTCPLCDGSGRGREISSACILCPGLGQVPAWIAEKLSRALGRKI